MELDEYFMGIAMAVRGRANCTGNRVGAVIALENRIISTGYNGTPERVKNCLDGGCDRCAHREKYPSGTGYDLCICVHAEQNALLAAARFGNEIRGASLYTTMQPCFGCLKELLQAGIDRVVYLHEWTYPDPDVNAQYELLQAYVQHGVEKLGMNDPDASWAVSKLRKPSGMSDDTGHTEPEH